MESQSSTEIGHGIFPVTPHYGSVGWERKRIIGHTAEYRVGPSQVDTPLPACHHRALQEGSIAGRVWDELENVTRVMDNGQCVCVVSWEIIFGEDNSIRQPPADECSCNASILYTTNHSYYLPKLEKTQNTLIPPFINFSFFLGLDW